MLTAKSLSLSVRFNGRFSGEPGLAGFIAAEYDGSGGNDWSYKMCRAPVKSSSPANQQYTQLFRGRMPFLLPDQQCRSTEGKC